MSKEIQYFIKESKRRVNVSLTIEKDERIVILVPQGFSNKKFLDKFINENKPWIIKNLQKIRNAKSKIKYTNIGDYEKYKNLAFDIAEKKVKYFNTFYNFSFNKISIRDQKTKWGSCSSSENLSLNLKFISSNECISASDFDTI